jgi:hypothetical protein
MPSNGVVLYRGPSLLNRKPIFCVAVGLTRSSSNTKTGGLIQTFILAENENPLEALKSGSDASVCGDCPHRPDTVHGKPGSCYVNVGQAPLAVYRAYQRGTYPLFDSGHHLKLFSGRVIRLGSYGDPAAVPLEVWKTICRVSRSWTGYTHAWRTCDADYARFCMASCETIDDRRQALALGYRTFRVRLPEQSLEKGEFVCPASEEAGWQRTCEHCRACSGSKAGGRNVSPVIVVHGLGWKLSRYRETLAQRIALPLL